MNDLMKLIGRLLFWIAWPVLRLYLFFRPERSKVLVVNGDEILLVWGMLNSGEWSLPGGGINKGETPEAAASRELKEETGLVASPDNLKKIGSKKYKVAGIPVYYQVYVLEFGNREDIAPHRPEILEACWFDTNKLPAKVSLETLDALRWYNEN
jgi:8-oxo-dGTP pyrophosphatase MutT (NUDIX family)